MKYEAGSRRTSSSEKSDHKLTFLEGQHAVGLICFESAVYDAVITPHAILLPEFPAGCEVKSSGAECRMTVRPMISETEKRLVKNREKA